VESPLYADRHADLVARCQSGERRAQYDLYRHYAKAMYNVCLRIVGHDTEAEDVLQEAFLDAFTHIGSFRQQSTFGAWLKQIVVNRAINHLRSRRVEWVELTTATNGHTDDGDSAAPTDWAAPEPVDEDGLQHEVERVRRAMNQLPEGYRVVLTLYLFEGYDHEEIGQILKINEATSRSQYLRAKKRLTQLMTR
jgi:RNA polymerase sigma factor (sigma-70 family)